jgi:DNA-binding beta-propeller fold protein YncE
MNSFIKGKLKGKIFTAVVSLMIMVGQVINPSVAEAATFNFVQSSWSGGATANTATHASDQTGWRESATSTGLVVGETVSLPGTAGSVVDDGSRGALTAVGTIAAGSNPQGITISPDGASVYVVNFSSNTVSQYSRNLTTGALTAVGTIAAGSSPYDITISPDGASVYVVNYTGNNVSQ